MREFVFAEENIKDWTVDEHLVKFVGAVIVFKYKEYYKIGLAGIDEVYYKRVATAEEVAEFLEEPDNQLLIDDLKVMNLEDREETSKEAEPFKNKEVKEEMVGIELKFDENKLPEVEVCGTALKNMTFKLGSDGKITLDKATIPSDLVGIIHSFAKTVYEKGE